MSSIGRLLIAALILCSVPAFAQDHPASPNPSGTIPTSQMPDFRTTPPPSEPWKIFPDPALQDKAMNLMATPDENTLLLPGDFMPGGLPTDTLCYSIRSYVVARDRKDSDSVHPAGYSTCQPASRYSLKATVLRQESADR